VGATFLSVSFSFFFFVLRSFLCLQWNISLDARNRQFLRFPFLMVTGQSCALLHLLLSLILYFSLSLSLSLSLVGQYLISRISIPNFSDLFVVISLSYEFEFDI